MQNAGSATIGQLWCTYEAEFYQQRYNDSNVLTDHYINSSVSSSTLFGGVNVYPAGSTLGVTLSLNTITFPLTVGSGKYLILAKNTQTSVVSTSAPLVTINSSFTLLAAWASSATDGNSASLNTNTFHWAWVIQLNSPGAVFALSGGSLTGGTVQDLWITQLPSSLQF